jgi:hypothetical protein
MSTIQEGELLYDYTLRITGLTEYGVGLESLMAGKAPPPPEGARYDVWFEGAAVGSKLKGKVKGVDDVRVRADDGQKISLHAAGVALPRKDSPIADLRENVTLATSSKGYAA